MVEITRRLLCILLEGNAMGLTIAQLTQAIRTKVDMGMETVVADNIAEHALGSLGFSNRINDNALEPTY